MDNLAIRFEESEEERGLRLRVHVLHEDEPIEGALVYVHDLDRLSAPEELPAHDRGASIHPFRIPEPASTRRTDPQGLAVLYLPERATVTEIEVGVRCAGFESWTGDLTAARPSPADSGTGGLELVARLERGASIAGRVLFSTDARPDSLSGLRVVASNASILSRSSGFASTSMMDRGRLQSAPRHFGYTEGSAAVEADGTFRVTGLTAGIRYYLISDSAEFRWESVDTIAPASGVVLNARAATGVHFLIREPDGSPILAPCTADLTIHFPDSGISPSHKMLSGSSPTGDLLLVWLHPEGATSAIPSQARIRPTGFMSVHLDETLEIGKLNVFEVTVEPQIPRRVELHASFADGAPVDESLRVRYGLAGWTESGTILARPRQAGVLEVELPEGHWHLRVHQASSLDAWQEWRGEVEIRPEHPGVTIVDDIVLPRGGALDYSGAGAQVGPLRISLRSDSRAFIGYRDPQDMPLTGIPPGVYDVRIESASDALLYEGRLTFSEGAMEILP